MEWISVKDKLPDDYVRVIMTDGIFVGEGFMVNREWARYDNFLWTYIAYTFITHWMPMPDRPNGRID